MNEVDRILERLQGQQPVLEAADELADTIMARIDELPVHEGRTVEPMPFWRVMFSSVLSAAATVAVGFFFVTRDATVPQNDSIVYSNADYSAFEKIRECRTAADVRALYFERQKPQSVFGINFAMIKNMYYEKVK